MRHPPSPAPMLRMPVRPGGSRGSGGSSAIAGGTPATSVLGLAVRAKPEASAWATRGAGLPARELPLLWWAGVTVPPNSDSLPAAGRQNGEAGCLGWCLGGNTDRAVEIVLLVSLPALVHRRLGAAPSRHAMQGRGWAHLMRCGCAAAIRWRSAMSASAAVGGLALPPPLRLPPPPGRWQVGAPARAVLWRTLQVRHAVAANNEQWTETL